MTALASLKSTRPTPNGRDTKPKSGLPPLQRLPPGAKEKRQRTPPFGSIHLMAQMGMCEKRGKSAIRKVFLAPFFFFFFFCVGEPGFLFCLERRAGGQLGKGASSSNQMPHLLSK
jgi:hypothetical protein